MKRKLIFKLFSFLSVFSVLFNSFYAPLYVLAQDQLEPTPTPVESLITPVTTDSLISLTPAEDLATSIPTEVPTTSAPTNSLMTLAPTSIPRLTDEPTPLVSPSETVLGEVSQTTDIPSDNEITDGEEKLDVFVFENADAQDVESEILPDFDYRELSSATLTTDKFDYAPTDAVVITGSGFSPNTIYELVIISLTGNFRFSDSVVSNESGKFIYTYQLDGVYRPEYKVEVLQGGVVLASASFLDSNSGKVRICHRTMSHSNPYVEHEPNIENNGSLSGGHLNHTGPIWHPGISGKWGDIIPPYQSGNFNYSGMNWDLQGQAIWDNGCKIFVPSPTPTPCVEGDTWVSSVFDFEQGTKKNGNTISSDRSNPDNALGMPDSSEPTVKFYSLGNGGWIILMFSGWVLDVSGNDLSFHEVTWGRDAYPVEKAKIEVSQDGLSWFGDWEVTNKDGGNGVGYIDFSSTGLPWIKYVRITDNTNYSLHNDEGDGYDLDAVGGVTQVCQQPRPSTTPSPSPTPVPYCGDGVRNGQEECDGTDGVTQGENFCTSTCKLVPIYDGAHSCPDGTVKSQNSIVKKTISATDPDGETFSLTAGGKYIFEISGTYIYDKNNPGKYADGAYATRDGWVSVRSDIGIWGTNKGVTSLLADLGNGVGVVEWDDDQTFNSNHTYQKYYSPTKNNVQFLISDWYDLWYSSLYNNQSAMSDNSGSLTLNVYECQQPVSEVKVCKLDNSQNPLPGWRVYLLGEKLNSFSVPSNGLSVNAGAYPDGSYVLLASGVYNYGDSRMNADAANSYRYVGLPCAGSNDGWVNGEAIACMANYLSLNFSVSGGPTAPGWGTYFSPDHIYAKAFGGGSLQAKIWDRCNSNQSEGCYHDNEGSLNLDIYKGYAGDTGQDGCITFSNVPYGSYVLGEVLQDGYERVSGEGKVDVDAQEEEFTLVNKLIPPPTIITGQKYNDQNYNGQKDENEPGLGNWTIYLAQKVDEVNVPALNMPTVSSNISLVSGSTYLLRVSGTFGAGDSITGDAKYSVRVPNTYWTDYVQNYESYGSSLLDLQINNSSVNWGTYNSNHIYWLTYTGGGSPINFRIYDIYPPNNSGQLDVKIYKVIDKTQTSSDGNYQFSYDGELSGEVIVAEKTQDGLIQTAPGEGYCSIIPSKQNTCNFGNAAGKGWIIVEKQTVPDNSNQSFNFSGTVSGSLKDNERLVSGELLPGRYDVQEEFVRGWSLTNISCDDQNSTWHVGKKIATYNLESGEVIKCVFTNTQHGSISGYKYEDVYANRTKDATYPVLPGWTINLYDSSGVLVESVQTDRNGKYTFGNLPAGTYKVCEVQQEGWIRISPSTDCYDNIVVSPGENIENKNFGNYKFSSISGVKFEDLNGNGIRDEGEPGIEGWTIRLYKEGEMWNLVKSEITGHTEVLGQYRFDNLEPGRYKICEVLQDGWMQTTPAGSNNRVQSDEAPRCRVVNIDVSGEVASGRNFGNFKLGKIYGYKYDEDGQTRLNGWSIFIDEDSDRFFDEGEEVVQTGISNEEWPSGYFEFTGLTAGNYSVCEVEQQGWQRMHPLGTNCQSVSVTSGSETEIYFQNRKVILGLALTKSNDAMGDLSAGSQVNYTLVIKNTGNQKLTGAVIKDAPAGGFTYVAGTGSLGGNPITPTINAGYLEWYIGVLGAGEEKILNYKLQTDSALVAGTYPNVAIATGVYIPSEYTASENSEELVFEPIVVEVLAVSEESEDEISGENVESNSGVPVNSEVRIAANLSYSTGVGSTGQVLGASTEMEGAVLPAAGSSTWNLLIALLSLLFGLGLKGLGTAVEENRINTKRIKEGFEKISAFLASLSLFLVLSSSVKAFSDYTYITKLSSYLNKDNFYLSYSALSENPITAQFYVRKDGDSTWRTLGSALSGASGQIEVKSSDIYGGDAKYFFKVVINGGTASDETSTTIDRSAPDPVSDYWKEKVGDGHYKLHWRNPNNSDYDRVKIYRSENKNFTADSSTEIATLWGTASSEMTSENAAAPGKEYYFAIRAIDKAGNASVVVADPETQVTAGAVLGDSTAATAVPKAEAVKLLPKEAKKGEVLGEEKVEEKAPSPKISSEEREQLGGVLGQAINFAKDRTGLALIVALALGVVSYFISNYFKKNK